MSSKRKGDGVSSTSESPKKARPGIFGGLTFHLFPSALSKGRKQIFEKQIDKHGGARAASLEAKPGPEGTLLVLIEDSTSSEEKRKAWTEKGRRFPAYVLIVFSLGSNLKG